MSRKYAIFLPHKLLPKVDSYGYIEFHLGFQVLRGWPSLNTNLNFPNMYGTLTAHMWCLVAAPMATSNISFPKAYIVISPLEATQDTGG